ncbi:MAG: xanthine dehydrogenase family protein subunit M [Hyphomicrobium aestuarii]|nr:xanthine dehydrogenase family protein subunit M [Hyphomicrobium aestuarii]
MIPGKFDYHRPATKTDAFKLLLDAGPDGRVLAGGHSLIPMMKLRLATPTALIDLGHISELKGISVSDKRIEIGATTTQHELIQSQELFTACPIIHETSLQIADPQIRYCGTLGGNIGNGDPGNDMPAVMQCLDAIYTIESLKGSRQVSARAFYRGAYVTALDDGEIITKISFVRPPTGHGYAYCKLKRKVGDYATAAAAVILEMSGGKVQSASITLTNVSDTPLCATAAAAAVTGTTLEPAAITAAVLAAEAITNPTADGRGSAAYRTRMAGVMVHRALELAKERAGDIGATSISASATGAPKTGKAGGMFGWLNR